MIRPPLEACRERKWETTAVAFAVVVVMAIPLGLALFGLCARSAAHDWLRGYTPVVYLEPQTTAEQADALAAEIATWNLVESASVRAPKAAHAELSARLGQRVVDDLGVTEAMLPMSIVIEPSMPVVGHINLVSRVSGLQARMEVDAVEVPSSGAMQVVTAAGVGLGVAALLGLLGVFAAVVLLFGYLQRLRRAERDLDRVLALFGAYSWDLRRPTLLRGVTLAAGCGVLVSVAGAVGLLGWQVWSVHIVGGAMSPPIAAWTAVLVPVLVLPFLGLFAGWLASTERVSIWRGAHA